MAQVYSVNAVGYVNTTLTAGWNLVSNPLKNQTDNTVATILATAPEGTTIYKWLNDGTTSGYDSVNVMLPAGLGWSVPDQTLVPGEGAFILVPTGSSSTVTFVGEVMQGSLTNKVPAGFSMLSSQVPQAGLVTTDLGFPAIGGDTIYTWVAGSYLNSTFLDGFGWLPEEPNLAVGQAFWSLKTAATAWTRTFSVNP